MLNDGEKAAGARRSFNQLEVQGGLRSSFSRVGSKAAEEVHQPNSEGPQDQEMHEGVADGLELELENKLDLENKPHENPNS